MMKEEDCAETTLYRLSGNFFCYLLRQEVNWVEVGFLNVE